MLAAGSTGSIQAVCALLHHVSNILSDHVLSFVQHELAEVSEEGFADILSKDSKVTSVMPSILMFYVTVLPTF